MKFLLDQNTETRILQFLVDQGHDVKRVARDYPAGLPDEQVLELARSEGRILITNDRDFGELIFRQQLPHTGVIYFRLPLDTTADQKIERLKFILIERSADLGQFMVVGPRRIRVRRSPR